LERWADSLRDYEDLKRELPGDDEVARALSEVQLGFKKSLGEKMNQMWYGGNVEDISSNDQFREAVSHSGTYPYFFSLSSVQELPSFAGSCAHYYYGSMLFHHKTSDKATAVIPLLWEGMYKILKSLCNNNK
jgi:hypothetical protein